MPTTSTIGNDASSLRECANGVGGLRRNPETMRLEFRPDFETVRDRWDAFWRGELPRPMICGVVPKAGTDPVERPPYGAGYGDDFEKAADQVLTWGQTHEFVGDAVPFYIVEFAADHFAALLGADLHFREDGHGNGWAVPCIDDLDSCEIRFRPEGKWWERTVRYAEALRHRCDGSLLISPPTCVANLDALAAVRGASPLLLDLVDNPDGVHNALEQITRAYADILDAFDELLDMRVHGSVTRHGLYCTGRTTVPQCDFSAMIGPDMFAEFAVPYLRREMAHLDAAEYHLDGPDAVKHLEALCGIEELDVIQWIAGAGEAESEDWNWLYARIEELGKGTYRWLSLSEGPEHAAAELRNWPTQKHVLAVGGAPRHQIERLIEELEAGDTAEGREGMAGVSGSC